MNPHQLSLAKQSWKVMPKKCQIKLKPKNDGVINPQNYNFSQNYVNWSPNTKHYIWKYVIYEELYRNGSVF